MRKFPAILLFALFALPSSPFAAEALLLSRLPAAELSYYNQVFDYTMDTVKPDTPFDWTSYSAKGSINASVSYESKSNAMCRNFTETFTVDGQSGNRQGVACKRVGNDGWCKLKTTNALTCALEPPSSIIEQKMRDAGEYFRLKEMKAKSLKNDYWPF